MLKKMFFLSLAFLMLGCGAAQALTMVSVAANGINVRSGPGDKYSVLWSLGTGFPLSVLEEQGDWYKVEDFEGDTGWIHKKLVERKPYMVVKVDTANVRSGPSERYKLVGKANRGVVFQTIKTKARWVKLKHESGLTGWISRDLLWGW